MTMTEQVRLALMTLPERSGVYLMRDRDKQVIYVGKAVNLKRRVKSYFKKGANHAVKVQRLVAKVAELETIITDSEMEALTLECNLIKQYRPRYNILLKDDKSYPYLKVTLQDKFPRVYPTHRVVQDGSRYFGPYTDSGAMYETLELLRSLFPLRTCQRLERQTRPCLQYHIKRCVAPCVRRVTAEEYAKMVKEVCMLLDGRVDDLIHELTNRLQQAVKEYAFEQAAKLRDQLQALRKVTQAQKAIIDVRSELDVIGLVEDHGRFCVQIFFVRKGRLVGHEHCFINDEDGNEEEVLTAFIKQYYHGKVSESIPRQILMQVLPSMEEQEPLVQWLTYQAGHAVELLVPKRGIKRELLLLANQNARKLLDEQYRRGKIAVQEPCDATEELAQAIGMTQTIGRMDCFDISHTQGTETVASMVVFRGGEASKRDYRRYKILSTEGMPNDFKAMREVVYRRYQQHQDLPDLVVIDGGKGQLASAVEVLQELGLGDLAVVGLAKREEEIFKPGRSDSILLAKDSAALHLIQRIRDEAHRFAITYHRKLRTKRNLASLLDKVPGLGPKRKAKLYQVFKNLAAIKEASVEDLSNVESISPLLAQRIHDFLRSTDNLVK